jgi:itaconyl-CoA hydratase
MSAEREPRTLEMFEVGTRIRHPMGRTISDVDNAWFTLLTCNTNQSHFNTEYAAQSEFGRPLVNSCLTLALVTGLSVDDVSVHAIANLGWHDVRLLGPVFSGDTLYAESEVLEVRRSASRPGQGIVRVETLGFTGDGAVVISFERSVLLPDRATFDRIHPVAATPRPQPPAI